MPISLKTRHAYMLLGILSLMAYQNCSQSPGNSTSTNSSFESSLPFAYKSVADTVGYMSCSEITDESVNPRAYFTLRVGAYSSATGGMSLSKAFFDATKFYDASTRASALSGSDLNRGAILNLSIRNASNFQLPYKVENIEAGEDIDTFLPVLESPQIAGPLASGLPLSATADGQRYNYFPGTESKRLMEASLRFLSNEMDAAEIRNNFDARTAYLVMGYTKMADILDTSLRSPFDVSSTISGMAPTRTQTSANTVYGTGLLLNFSFPVPFTSGARRVLSSQSPVQEKDLITNQTKPANWDCSTNYQFQVVRPEDKAAGKVVCNASVDRYTTGDQATALNAIRRVLRVEDWYVDLDNHCVMPKDTGDYCYGANLGTRTIQYSQTSCVHSPTTTCPHFVSVCIRH